MNTIEEWKATLAREHTAQMAAIHREHAAWCYEQLLGHMARREKSTMPAFRVMWTTYARTALRNYDEQTARAAAWEV